MPTSKQFTVRLEPNIIASLEMERQKRGVHTIQQVIYQILEERYSGGKPIINKELIKVCEFLNQYLSCLRVFDPDTITLKQAEAVTIEGNAVKIETKETLNKTA